METEKHYYFIKAIRFITDQNIKFAEELKLTQAFSKEEKCPRVSKTFWLRAEPSGTQDRWVGPCESMVMASTFLALKPKDSTKRA